MKRRGLLLSLALITLWSCGSGSDTPVNSGGASNLNADTIFVNGHVLPINPAVEVQALAIKGDRILLVGDTDSVLATKGPNTNVIDLQGRTLMPGFVEPHIHVGNTAVALNQTNLLSEAPNQPIGNVTTQLSDAAKLVPANGWLQASGFDPSRTSPLFSTLTVQTLDAVSTTVPIFVLNASEHIAYVNSKAFELAGVDKNTPNPPGGEYVKDANGNLTGQLNEPPSYAKFTAKFPSVSGDQVVDAMRTTLANFNKAGVTSCGDLNTGIAYGLNTEVSVLKLLAQEPSTGVRVFCYLSFLSMKGALPVTPGEGNDMLRFIGVKFTLDGSTQGFTAALNQPYLDGTSGTLDYPDTNVLFNNVLPFAQDGWQIAMHCNGDRALDQALDVHARLRVRTGMKISDRRHRIEHLTVQTESQLDAVKALELTPSMTPGHIFYWGQVFFQSILGPDRANRIDACASLKARGVPFSLNSDTTTTTVEPLRYVQNVVTRVPQLNPPAILGADQRISVDDALRAITLDAAYQLFMEDKVGSLESGKYADLVILSDNPRTIPIANMRSIRVLATYLGGVRKF